jgi:peptide/nickel transport system substrate-binding protein
LSNATRLTARAAAIALAAVVAAALLGAAQARPDRTAGPKPGGVYRVAFESSFGFTDDLDPTGEYLNYGFEILSNLVDRTLVGFDHVAGVAGNRLVPDIATAVPRPTNGGLTYTFHIKHGVRFGPPVDRPVTSQDVLYAMERIARPKDGAEYGFYYSPIVGFDAYSAGKAKSITGIRTPDRSTIVFTLTKPTGDFLYRMALPAAGPIPPEIGACFEGQPGRYGRDLVSTGPYMLQGADKVDGSSCAALKPMSGWDGVSNLTLVRNPEYDPKTDSPAARQSFPDEFVFTIDPNLNDIIDRVSAGELEDENATTLPPAALEQYSNDSAKRNYLHVNGADALVYLSMNLTQPPFDDIHVRKAMNWILDKAAIRQITGGPLMGAIAGHIVPNGLLGNQLADYDPYRTPQEAGSLAKAKAAMRGSKYDVDKNGTCGAPACHDVLLLNDTALVNTRTLPIVVHDAQELGITFHVSTISGAYPTLQTPSKNIAVAFPGWGKDYADPYTFLDPNFNGRSIIPEGNTNYSLVGLKPAQAKTLGVTGTTTGIPSVDPQLDHCAALSGPARLTCYAALDRTLMTTVVPWVPYLWTNNAHIVGPHVTQWQYDQFSDSTAYAHVAVS